MNEHPMEVSNYTLYPLLNLLSFAYLQKHYLITIFRKVYASLNPIKDEVPLFDQAS